MRFAATDQYAPRSVPDLMAELQEAEIRARIKRARKEAGLSQTELADLLAVIPRTVQNYENDHVPWNRIRDIAEITAQSTRWLLHGDTDEQLGDDDAQLERLDRIEQRLDRIYVLLTTSEATEEEAAAVAEALAPLQAATASPKSRAPGRSGSQREASKRRRA